MPINAVPAWTPVALSADLPSGTVIPARLPQGSAASASLALWRSQAGSLSAVADRCPHRGMRLSHGFVRGEALSCIYHGWSYGKDGGCLRIPAHPGLTPPEAIRVATHRAEERDGVVWVTASEEPGDVPSHDGFHGLRTITVGATPHALATFLGAGAEHTVLDWPVANIRARLLTAPAAEDGATLVHLLVDAGATAEQKTAASRALEALRRAAEIAASRGDAA